MNFFTESFKQPWELQQWVLQMMWEQCFFLFCWWENSHLETELSRSKVSTLGGVGAWGSHYKQWAREGCSIHYTWLPAWPVMTDLWEQLHFSEAPRVMQHGGPRLGLTGTYICSGSSLTLSSSGWEGVYHLEFHIFCVVPQSRLLKFKIQK